MTVWKWLNRAVLIAIHDAQLAEHGGGSGIRDEALFDSALSRPLNLAAYGDHDVASLAAAYGFGLSKNHAFVDGNKRIALISIQLFLEINGWHLTATDDQCVSAMVGVAAGEISEPDLAKWVREHVLQFEGNGITEFVRPKLN